MLSTFLQLWTFLSTSSSKVREQHKVLGAGILMELQAECL